MIGKHPFGVPLDRVITNIRNMNVAVGNKAIPILEEMLHEYRKQTG